LKSKSWNCWKKWTCTGNSHKSMFNLSVMDNLKHLCTYIWMHSWNTLYYNYQY